MNLSKIPFIRLLDSVHNNYDADGNPNPPETETQEDFVEREVFDHAHVFSTEEVLQIASDGYTGNITIDYPDSNKVCLLVYKDGHLEGVHDMEA